MTRFLRSKGFINASSSVIAILVGLFFGFLILLVSNAPDAVRGIGIIMKGGFSGGAKGIGQVLYFATPIIMTGLSVGFAFKTGLFNIGATGQYTVGAFVAIYIGVHWTSLGGAQWVVALLGAAAAGALWAFIPGFFKAHLNVNEVISSIMMNYIGMSLVNLLTKKYIYDSTKNLSMDVAPTAVLPKWGLDDIFYNMRGNYKDISTVNCGIIIAVLVAIAMYVVLSKTTFGYELKACGYNRFASRYAGVNEKRSIVLSMVIAGALAGLGGGLLYLAGTTGRHYQVLDVLLVEGFNGIPVALLGLSNPIGIVFSGIFVAYITLGGNYLQQLSFVPEVIDIIIAIIIYFAAFSRLFKDVALRLMRGRDRHGLEMALAEGVGMETPAGADGAPAEEADRPDGEAAPPAPPEGPAPDGGRSEGEGAEQ